MKKFLLSLAAVAFGFSMASAVQVTLTMDNLTPKPDGSQETLTSTVDGYTILLEKADATNIPTVNGTAKDLRIYAGGKVTITAPSGVNMTALDFTISTQGKKRLSPVTASVGTVSQDQGVTTWAGNAHEVCFTVTAGGRSDYGTDDNKAGQFDFTAIVVTADGEGSGTDPNPPTPTDPTEPEETTHYASFADFVAAGTGAKGILDGPVSVCYQGGQYMFIKDAKAGYGMIYAASGTFVNGDQFAQVEGQMDIYNGTPEIKNAVLPAATKGAAVLPDVLGLDEISADMVNTYVKIEGVDIVAEGSNFYATDGTTKLQVYKRFNDCTPAAGENMTIIGFVAVYRNNPQIYPCEITTAGGEEVKVCATPYFSVAPGAVEEGTAVEITCTTEGAKIYYTLDGTEPTVSSSLYSAPIVINAAVTIKAIAVAEGYENSPVKTGEYTIKAAPVVDPSAQTAVLDFSDCASFTPALGAPTEASTGVDIPLNTEYASNGFKFSVNGEESGALPRIWMTTKNATEFRAYKNQTFTVTAENSAWKIVSLTFEGNRVTSTYITGVADGVLAGSGNNTQTVTLAGSAQISKITVAYSGGSGVEDITATDENAPAEYYNLQGVRVANPAAGNLYIKRQGTKTTKVVF